MSKEIERDNDIKEVNEELLAQESAIDEEIVDVNELSDDIEEENEVDSEDEDDESKSPIDEESDDDEPNYDDDETIFIPASMQERAETDQEETSSSRKIDALFIVLAAVVVVLVVVFIGYFSGAYLDTSGYAYISTYGFTFSEPVLQEYPDDPSISVFNVTVNNNRVYDMYVYGLVNSDNKKIRELYVSITVNAANVFSDNRDMYAPIVPYLQMFYPEMSIDDATDFLIDLRSNLSTEKVRGNFKAAVYDQGSAQKSTLVLMLAGKDVTIV